MQNCSDIVKIYGNYIHLADWVGDWVGGPYQIGFIGWGRVSHPICASLHNINRRSDQENKAPLSDPTVSNIIIFEPQQFIMKNLDFKK